MPAKTVLVLLSAFVLNTPAQTTAYYPDGNATSGGCNTIPLGSSYAANAKTFVTAIPASAMAGTGGVIADIAMSSCSAGTLAAVDAIVGFGHIPSPTPTPLNFPQFDANNNVTSLGDFLDFTVSYNSTTQGILAYTFYQDTWSPMRLPLVSPFVWNGTDAVGFYLSMQNITYGATYGTVRTDVTVERRYAPGYRALASNNGSLTSGPKLEINPASGLRLDAGYDAGGTTATVAIQYVPPTATEGYTLISLSTAGPVGGGLLFGLNPDSVTWTVIHSPLAPGSPFHWVANIPGAFPSVPLTLPSSVFTPFQNQTWDIVAVALDTSLTVLDTSNILRTTW